MHGRPYGIAIITSACGMFVQGNRGGNGWAVANLEDRVRSRLTCTRWVKKAENPLFETWKQYNDVDNGNQDWQVSLQNVTVGKT